MFVTECRRVYWTRSLLHLHLYHQIHLPTFLATRQKNLSAFGAALKFLEGISMIKEKLLTPAAILFIVF